MSGGTEGIGLNNMIAIGAAFVATGAFIFSAMTYRRNRKSEQIRVARELTDRIETKRHDLWLVDDKTERLTDPKMGYEIFRNWLWHLGATLYELEYFTHLVNKREIKDKFLIELYTPEIKKVLEFGRSTLSRFRERLQHNTDLSDNQLKDFQEVVDRYERLIDELCTIWKCDT